MNHGSNVGYENYIEAPRVRIKKLVMVPTKEYNDVYHRPYKLNVNNGTLNRLENVIDNQMSTGARNISSISLATEVPDIMQQSEVPTHLVGITNGWGSKRYRFILEVESDMSGSMLVSYIQGYSDFYDPSFSGHIDPNMNMHINSITNVIQTVDPDTNMLHSRVSASFNIMHDPVSGTYEIQDMDNQLKLVRPKDVLEGMSALKMNGQYDDASVRTFDTRSVYGNVAQTSRRSNATGVEHVASVLNGFMASGDYTEIGYEDTDKLAAAANVVSEDRLYNTPFMDALGSVTGALSSVIFTLDVLARLKPDLESVLYVAEDTTDTMPIHTNMLDTEYTESFGVPTIEASIATTVSESINSILIENMLSVVAFTVTNMTPNSEIIIAPGNARSFIPNIDITVFLDRFFNKFKTLVMMMVTKNNMIGLDLHIAADVLGDTTIAVSINGQQHVIFRLPTFCNSLYSPIITNAVEQEMLVDDFTSMVGMAASY